MTDDPKRCQMWLGFSKSIGVVTAFPNNLYIVLQIPPQNKSRFAETMETPFFIVITGCLSHQGQYV